jgi:8-oxo-dGTP pyrophosphatase MutT (NUDIX family)
LLADACGVAEEGYGSDNRIAMLFGDTNTASFTSGWEVLMGQSEVLNWMRSSSDTRAQMRYGGEYKFAGGSQDEGETIVETAVRELEEEVSIDIL